MEKIKHIGLYPCPFGFFRIVEEEDAVVAIDVVKERQEEERPSEVTDWAARELHEYLEGERRAFTFPYRLVGTLFRLQVWKELEKVPYGETTTYKRLAEAIGRPGAYHAVGGAVGANPLSICVPCHRVIGTNGSLTGYAWGLPMKEALLELERR
ncbi:methylated-DNA--[protein]-cysteine S-methyltransferase [Mitsuokella jalaludinii]|uniref:methylated-DNA--[protein]-cysteine S-methyltransferase n=1 Tax=Mitsuokella jalaludinii TaxID=187979 RepID=UPI00242D4649|nr:methylated-DNA--[protein]-cysteine S-methyltransferase [Mitsuokella jalaludinii]MCI6606836.1 methylated-DNA--[protein]-cysteine S-methyltransferase [Mitsuokella jalaludinii]MCI7715933.1 methylated-DNA--[protein]-cysteine S-methyltransferase [Mitsuokella jalaludinii]MDD7745551.1 methylated-DNA--[protein]-cysteine S-methyltransferase [Mitsuokella jalaludinii]MDY5364778.1 methylated-DNA--[protein]-cysteine S-methyltransferase [Mitsuokella jalaludinii]